MDLTSILLFSFSVLAILVALVVVLYKFVSLRRRKKRFFSADEIAKKLRLSPKEYEVLMTMNRLKIADQYYYIQEKFNGKLMDKWHKEWTNGVLKKIQEARYRLHDDVRDMETFDSTEGLVFRNDKARNLSSGDFREK